MHFQVIVATAHLRPVNIVYKPIESFLSDVEISIAQANVNDIRNHFDVQIDHYMQSIEHLPRESFDTLFMFNARTVVASRLPGTLKQGCVQYLKELKAEYVVEFNKVIAQQTLAVKNYKTVVANIDTAQSNYREKLLEQAPIIADSLNDILGDLSRTLKRIVSEFMNEIYTISVDTLVNEAANWRMNDQKRIVWVRPDITHLHLLPYGTTIADQFMLPMGPPVQNLNLPGQPPQPQPPQPQPQPMMNQFGPPNPGKPFGPPPSSFDQSGPNNVQFAQGNMLPPAMVSLPMH